MPVMAEKFEQPWQLFDLSDKTAIVTGSGRGLGKAMAKGIAKMGASVVICSRTQSEAEETADEIEKDGGTAIAETVDVSSYPSCEGLMANAVKKFGKVNALINNAGIDIITPAVECVPETWDEIININLKGYYNCARIVGLHMLEQGSGGSIVNNSSIASEIGASGLLAYGAAKGGVNQITRVLAIEWAQSNIRVNAIGPGYFENIMPGAREEHARPEKQQQVKTFTPMGRRGVPEELIGPVVFLLSDASSYVTGAILYVDGGYTAM